MAFEIERKFLVDKAKWSGIKKPVPLQVMQGYIFNAGNKSCRIRITNNNKAVLNIKQGIDDLHRHEFETEISIHDAQILLEEMGEGFIQKSRYEIFADSYKWEVDVFEGANEGLIVAEIELPAANSQFNKPDWVGEEVTFDKRYLNTNLAENPYQSWNHHDKEMQ